eukprot:753871-Hanusia_phi.AAC.3
MQDSMALGGAKQQQEKEIPIESNQQSQKTHSQSTVFDRESLDEFISAMTISRYRPLAILPLTPSQSSQINTKQLIFEPNADGCSNASPRPDWKILVELFEARNLLAGRGHSKISASILAFQEERSRYSTRDTIPSPSLSTSNSFLDTSSQDGSLPHAYRGPSLKPQIQLKEIPNVSNSVQWHQIVSITTAYSPKTSEDGGEAFSYNDSDFVSQSLTGQAVTLIVPVRLTAASSPIVFCGQAVVPSVAPGDEISGWFDLQDAGGRPMFNEQGNQSKLYINLFYGQPREIIESNGKKFSIM